MARRRQEGSLTRFVRKYWGYLFLAAAIAGWQEHAFTLAVIAGLCALSLVYFLAAAPMWCMAETRDGTCAARILDCVTDLRCHQLAGWLAGCCSRLSTCYFVGY